MVYNIQCRLVHQHCKVVCTHRVCNRATETGDNLHVDGFVASRDGIAVHLAMTILANVALIGSVFKIHRYAAVSTENALYDVLNALPALIVILLAGHILYGFVSPANESSFCYCHNACARLCSWLICSKWF